MKTFTTSLLILILIAICPQAAVRAESDGYTIAGTVYYSTMPVTGVRVDLYDAKWTEPPIATIYSDGSGHYALYNNPSGIYNILFTPPTGDLQGHGYSTLDVKANYALDAHLEKVITVI